LKKCAGRSAVGQSTLPEAAISEWPTSNMPPRLIGPSEVTVSRSGSSAEMIFTRVGWAQLGANPAIAIDLELVANRHHGRTDLGVIGSARRRVIVGGARQTHQTASFGDGEAMGPVMTDVFTLLGRGARFAMPPL
jgi:hypothetical protein